MIRVFQTASGGMQEIGALNCPNLAVKVGDTLTVGFMKESVAVNKAPLAVFVDLRIEQITEPRHDYFADLVTRVAVVDRYNAKYLSMVFGFHPIKAFSEYSQ